MHFLEGHRNSLRCRALLRVIGCHEDEYFVRPILIKIDNCAELSSGDDSRVEFITEAPDRGPQRAFLMICSMALLNGSHLTCLDRKVFFFSVFRFLQAAVNIWRTVLRYDAFVHHSHLLWY